MTRAVMAPGLDQEDVEGGAKGVFAGIFQGATPKYAYNTEATAGRPDLYRNTMARMFVRIGRNELSTFHSSVADDHARLNLVPRLVGSHTAEEGTAEGRRLAEDARRGAQASSDQGNGYLDFLIQNVQMSMQEKIQVSETLSDNYVAYAFGSTPPVWNFSGALINSVQDDQASNMFRLYTHILRATQMARRQKSLSLSFDSYVVNGVMMNMNMALSSSNELVVPFSFQLLVKRVFIVNYTHDWTPTRAGTPFPADVLARAFDQTAAAEGPAVPPTVAAPAGAATGPVAPEAVNQNATPPVAPPAPRTRAARRAGGRRPTPPAADSTDPANMDFSAEAAAAAAEEERIRTAPQSARDQTAALARYRAATNNTERIAAHRSYVMAAPQTPLENAISRQLVADDNLIRAQRDERAQAMAEVHRLERLPRDGFFSSPRGPDYDARYRTARAHVQSLDGQINGTEQVRALHQRAQVAQDEERLARPMPHP